MRFFVPLLRRPHAPPRVNSAGVVEAEAEAAISARHREVDVEGARAQSLDRVRKARQRPVPDANAESCRQVAQEKAAMLAARAAKARVRERNAAAVRKKERDVTRLVSTQLVSSIEALNVERLIAPRMEERFSFRGQLTPREEARFEQIMRSDCIGHFG